MKKGCFLTVIVLFTVIVGVVFYIVKYKGNFLKEYSKNKVLDVAVGEFDKKMNEVKTSVYKDSMKIAVHNFFADTKKYQFDTAMKKVQDVMDESKYLYRDGIVDSSDFSQLKKILARYERPTKN